MKTTTASANTAAAIGDLLKDLASKVKPVSAAWLNSLDEYGHEVDEDKTEE